MSFMHSEDTIKGRAGNYSSLSKEPTEKIINSLKPGSEEPLRVGPDGKIWDGNTRIKILQERGIDINQLPRTPYIPRGLNGCFMVVNIFGFIVDSVLEQRCTQDPACECEKNPYCS